MNTKADAAEQKAQSAGQAADQANQNANTASNRVTSLAGTVENLVITQGALELTVGDEHHRLAKGDSIVFVADVPHVYENPGATPALMMITRAHSGLLSNHRFSGTGLGPNGIMAFGS